MDQYRQTQDVIQFKRLLHTDCLQDWTSSLLQILRLFGGSKRSTTAHSQLVLAGKSPFKDSDHLSAWSYCIHCTWKASHTAFTLKSSSTASKNLCTTGFLLPLALIPAAPHLQVMVDAVGHSFAVLERTLGYQPGHVYLLPIPNYKKISGKEQAPHCKTTLCTWFIGCSKTLGEGKARSLQKLPNCQMDRPAESQS